MQCSYWSLLFACAWVPVLACSSDEPADPASRAGRAGSGASGRDGAAGSAVADAGPVSDVGPAAEAATKDVGADDPRPCGETDARAIRIYGATLSSASTQFEQLAELRGPGVRSVASLRASGLVVLGFTVDGLLLYGMDGFWDVPFARADRWHETGGLVSRALAADLDGDGDHDPMIVFSSQEDLVADADGGADGPAQVTHVVPYERTTSGLSERSQILQGWLYFGAPFALGDLDGDGKSDLFGYLEGVAVGYFNGGGFAFTRRTLSERSDRYATMAGSFGVHAADRNGDDAPDLVAVFGDVLGGRYTVLMNDGAGRFLAPGTEVRDEPFQGGLELGDVSGDGLADVVAISVRNAPPRLRVSRSVDSTTLAEPVEIAADVTGLRLADLDGDGDLDILTSRADELLGVVWTGSAFEERKLPLSLPRDMLDFATDPGSADRPARVYVAQLRCED